MRHALFVVCIALTTLALFSCGAASGKAGAPGGENRSASGTLVTFIELGSVNCVPCRAMQPIMEEVRETYGDQVDVVFHDVWTKEGEPFAGRYGIKVIPTQVFLDSKGKEYYRHEGFFPMEQLVEVLKKGGVR